MALFPIFQGFLIGLSMIIPIGAQNSFVLNQAIKRNHHLVSATICMLCDLVLILLGVYGGSQLIGENQTLLTLITWAGILFLTVYGCFSFLAAIRSYKDVTVIQTSNLTFKVVVLTTLAVTLLNPHVYLDTFVLLGSIGNQFDGINKHAFVFGCLLASFVWFYALAIGAAKLSPFLNRNRVRRCIDFIIGLIMWGIAISLFFSWNGANNN